MLLDCCAEPCFANIMKAIARQAIARALETAFTRFHTSDIVPCIPYSQLF